MENKCLFRVKCDVLFLSVFRREGEGLRIFWDRLREPSFTSRWNPFTTDFPYTTFTYHPVRDISDTFTSICNVRALIRRNYHRLEFSGQKKTRFTPSEDWSHGLSVPLQFRGLTWLDCYDESRMEV